MYTLKLYIQSVMMKNYKIKVGLNKRKNSIMFVDSEVHASKDVCGLTQFCASLSKAFCKQTAYSTNV